MTSARGLGVTSARAGGLNTGNAVSSSSSALAGEAKENRLSAGGLFASSRVGQLAAMPVANLSSFLKDGDVRQPLSEQRKFL